MVAFTLLAAVAAATGGVAGETTLPFRYAIVEIDAGGAAWPLWQRRVLLSPGRSAPTATAAAAADMVAATARDAAGRPVFEQIVRPARWLRGEFAGAGPGAPIDGFMVPLEHSVVVVRLPDGEDYRLEMGTPGSAPQVLPPLGPAGLAAPDALAGAAATLTPLQLGGPPGNRLDMVIVGEGYTEAQQGSFLADAGSLAASLFDRPPYAEYRGFFNVSALFVPSPEEGADHPPYRDDCTAGDRSCCADAAAQADPRAGTFVATAFDATFCTLGIHRLLTVNTYKVLAAAAAAPDWDILLVLVNDPVYGGSGGEVAVSSREPRAPSITEHELGHSFALLADEYESPYPGYPSCSDAGGLAGCEANVTDVVERAAIKWSPRILPSTPLPTPANDPAFGELVGLFEGARYRVTGMYRPQRNCLMRTLEQVLCEVCRAVFVERLYSGGWGFPAGGIDLIEPGSESPHPGAVAAVAGDALHFSVELLEPGGASPRAEWRVDGRPVAGASGAELDWTPPGPGVYTVELVVTDPSGFLLPARAAELAAGRRWDVTVPAQRPPRRRLLH